MRKQIALKVFIAFPSDVRELRERVEAAVEELDETWKRRDIRLDSWAWDTDAIPGFDPRGPQALIDPHIEDCDMLVGIFRSRLGAALPNGESGAEHEVRRAIAAGSGKLAPRVMLYFQEPPPEPATEEKQAQMRALARFRDEVKTLGLYHLYSDPQSLEQKVRQHLQTLLFEKFDVQPQKQHEPLPLAWSATSAPVWARSEGVAEQMGQITVVVAGGVPRSAGGTTLVLNVKVTVTLNITNRVDAKGLTDAQLLMFDQGSGTPLHAVHGRLVSDDSVLFEGVPLDPPGADTRRHMRIINLRANAQAAGDFGTVFGTVDVRPINQEAIQCLPVNAIVALADSMPSFVSSVSLQVREFSRARGVNPSLIRGGKGASFTGHVVFTEGFAGALSTRGQETAGTADCGTRFLARFLYFPAGVRLFVSQFNLPGSAHRLRSGAARLVAADCNGVTSTSHRVPECAPVLVEGSPVVELRDGGCWAVWELTEAGPVFPGTAKEEIRFGIAVAAEPGEAELGTGIVTGTLAPLTDVFRASTTAPVPRFVDIAMDQTLFTVVP